MNGEIRKQRNEDDILQILFEQKYQYLSFFPLSHTYFFTLCVADRQ